jgi:hypothetical protein
LGRKHIGLVAHARTEIDGNSRRFVCVTIDHVTRATVRVLPLSAAGRLTWCTSPQVRRGVSKVTQGARAILYQGRDESSDSSSGSGLDDDDAGNGGVGSATTKGKGRRSEHDLEAGGGGGRRESMGKDEATSSSSSGLRRGDDSSESSSTGVL